jgi:beta-xylosidase
MKKTYYLIFLGFFLAACNSFSPSSPTSSIEIVLPPSATATIPVPQTPTFIAPTVTVQPTADPNFFRDDFNGLLDAQWSWLRENPRNWSLSDVPGSLEIQVDQGYVVAHTNPNLLLRPAPAEDFQIETQLTFRPKNNFQFAGLTVYESDSNFIQAGRAYCDAVGCVGEGFYMDYYRRGVVVEPDFGQAFKEIDPVLLRLTRQGDIYTFEVSTDGKVWFMIGSHTSDMNPLQIGLVAGQTLRGQSDPATFEYFEVRSLP